jgi:hypothetical protein
MPIWHHTARYPSKQQFSVSSSSKYVAVATDDRSNSMNNKVPALKMYRKAKGLCFTCGEKWGPDHKCNNTVQLHVVEELMAMLHMSDSEGEPPTGETKVFEDAIGDTHEVLLSISKQAMNGSEAPCSMRLMGQIQGYDVLIVIDSGSSNNFVSADLAAKLKGFKN